MQERKVIKMKAKKRQLSNHFKISLIFVSIFVLCPVSLVVANQPPVANVEPDNQTVYVGEEAWFTHNGSYDPDGWIESYDWDFGDGYSSSASNITITYIYCVPGNYTVTLTVTDNENATDTDTVLVTVLGSSGNQPPVAEADPDHQTVYVGEEAWFTGNGSYDPGGATGEVLSESQPLMIEPSSGWVEWNAEYNASQGVLYNVSGNLTRIDLPLLAEGFDVCGGSGIPGEYLVVLSFSDEFGNVLGNTSTIVNTTASGGPPYVSTWYTFKFSTAIRVTAGNLYYISVEAPDESPTKGAFVMWRGIGVEGFDPYPKAHGHFDGVIVDDFTFKTYLEGNGGPSSLTFHWDFGDGTYGTGMTVKHIYSAPGNYTVTLTVTDNEGATDNDTVTVTVLSSPSQNQPPVADADPDHQQVFIGEKTWFYGYNSYDPDGWIVSYEWDFGDRTNGSGVNISHIYITPGNYSVTLTVTDNCGATDQDIAWAIVIEPNNEPPVGNKTESPKKCESILPEEYGIESTKENETGLSEGIEDNLSKKGVEPLLDNYDVLWVNLIIILFLVVITLLILSRRRKEEPQEQQHKIQTRIISLKST